MVPGRPRNRSGPYQSGGSRSDRGRPPAPGDACPTGWVPAGPGAARDTKRSRDGAVILAIGEWDGAWIDLGPRRGRPPAVVGVLGHRVFHSIETPASDPGNQER